MTFRIMDYCNPAVIAALVLVLSSGGSGYSHNSGGGIIPRVNGEEESKTELLYVNPNSLLPGSTSNRDARSTQEVDDDPDDPEDGAYWDKVLQQKYQHGTLMDQAQQNTNNGNDLPVQQAQQVQEAADAKEDADFVTIANALDGRCNGVGNFLYKPTKCDPGYWCGCSDPTRRNCQPSNNTDETFWAGHYTEGSTVYVGWAKLFPDDFFQCNETLYCPGKLGNLSDCPKLCEKGNYCPDSSTQLPCPKGSYCLTGSTEPTDCHALDRCDEEGQELPRGDWYLIVVLCVTFVCFETVVLVYLYLNERFPFRRRSNKEGDDEEEEDAMAEGDQEAPSVRRSRGSRNKKKTWEARAMRASVLTTPKPSFTIDVKFQDLQLTLKNGIQIMAGVTGELRGGQFTAIMGPSGAGKSTFLSLLAGKTEPTGGTVTVNGEVASLKDYRRLVGFVPQEDIMLRELTVEENIRHSAFARLPADLPRSEKLDRVQKVMESLDLVQIRNSVIGDELVRGISGGQRKRVNVAMELVADPSLLALDEPTSGLDSTTSSNLCDALRQLADTGVNVAAVVHQPKIEILEMFSNVLLLGPGGKTVYMGPTRGMTAYFERIGFPLPPRMNPADYYMDVVAGLVPRENHPDFKKEYLFDLWAKSPENAAYSKNDTEGPSVSKADDGKGSSSLLFKRGNHHRETPGIVGQTCLLFQRAVLQRCRVPRNTLIPLILSAATGLLMGFFTRSLKIFYYGIPRVVTGYGEITAASQFMRNYPIPPLGTYSTDQNSGRRPLQTTFILCVNIVF